MCVARSKAKSCSWALLTGAAPCWSHMHQGALLILCPCHSPQGDSVGEVSVLLQPTQGWRHEWARCLGIALNHLSCIVTKSYIFLSLPSPILSSLQILFSPNFSHHFFFCPRLLIFVLAPLSSLTALLSTDTGHSEWHQHQPLST